MDSKPTRGILLSINDANVFSVASGLPYNFEVDWRMSSCNEVTASVGKYTSATVMR